MEEKPTNVIAALARVTEELPAIGKDSRASSQQGGYAYRGIEQITRHAAPLLAKYGVVFVPRVVEWERDQITVNGKPWTDDRMEIIYTVYGPGGVDDRITVGPIPAIGRDNSDKGGNKCMTQAYKYALLQVLCIADAKDDADSGSPEADSTDPELDALKAGYDALTLQERIAFDAWRSEAQLPQPWHAHAEGRLAVRTKLGEIQGVDPVTGEKIESGGSTPPREGADAGGVQPASAPPDSPEENPVEDLGDPVDLARSAVEILRASKGPEYTARKRGLTVILKRLEVAEDLSDLTEETAKAVLDYLTEAGA